MKSKLLVNWKIISTNFHTFHFANSFFQDSVEQKINVNWNTYVGMERHLAAEE
jgi:hypothetical protein